MKKYICLCILAVSRLCAGGFDHFYLGAGGGVLQVRGLEYSAGDVRDFYSPGAFDDPAAQKVLKDTGTQVYKVTAQSRVKAASVVFGYHLFKYLSIEGEYLKAGTIKTELHYNSLLPPIFNDPAPTPFQSADWHRLAFTSLLARAEVPLVGGLSGSAAAGITSTDNHYTEFYNYLGQENYHGGVLHEHSYGARFTAGLSYRIAPHFGVRLDWSRYNYRGQFVFPHPTIDSLNLQVIFKL